MLIQETSEMLSENISEQHSPLVTSQSEMIRIKIMVLRQLFWIFYQRSGNPIKALKLIHQIRKKYQSTFGEPLLTKAAKVKDRYYWRLGTPGFPSLALSKMHENEVNRFFPCQLNYGLRTLLIAITKKCLLNCEHCFEWGSLNQNDQLSTSDIIQIVNKYQDYGTTQIMFSGGEPMLRVNDICEILSAVKPATDFWIITSGLDLDFENAKRLKAAGLTGVMVSLDHYDEAAHNRFRGSESSYKWALRAVVSANKAGLVTTLALCTTKTFVTKDNLTAYMNLAKVLGVSFVQIIEPRATGRYAGKDVELRKEEILLLEETYLEYNSSKVFKDYPIINYLGYHQRRVGCFGAGNRFFYIDADGDAHICPYCYKKVASALDFSATEMIDQISHLACHVFVKNTNN
jgi:MoaA/NifB/PqqE/SkfB family radical SAM enzyme